LQLRHDLVKRLVAQNDTKIDSSVLCVGRICASDRSQIRVRAERKQRLICPVSKSAQWRIGNHRTFNRSGARKRKIKVVPRPWSKRHAVRMSLYEYRLNSMPARIV
jgi:hypothetical protein